MTTDPECLFCKIVGGDIPADVVRETEHTVAFRDLNPQAPTHVLVVPRRHEPDIGSLVAAAPDEAATLLNEAREDANQSVFHCHAHVLAGRTFTWPPG